MSADLRSQLTEYGRYHREQQGHVGLDEIVARARGARRPVPPAAAPPRRLTRGFAVALVAALLVLVALGVIPVLLGGDSEVRPAETVVPGTTVPIPSTQEALDVDETRPPSTSSPGPEGDPEIDLDSLPLPVIAAAITSSSIGDVTWRIFESDGEAESFDAMEALGVVGVPAAEVDRRPDPSPVPRSVVAIEGPISVEVHSDQVAIVGDAQLTAWSFSFDPIGTAMLSPPDGLLERSADGRLLGLGDVTGDTIEVALYETETDADFSTHKPGAVDGEPIAIVARYSLNTARSRDGTVLRVVDSDTGVLVGSVTATIGLDPDLTIHWGFPLVRRGEYYVSAVERDERLFTLSDGEELEQVRPDWESGEAAAVVATEDRVLIYVEPARGGAYQVWETTDGRSWTSLGPPTGWPAGYADPQVGYEEGVFSVDLNDQLGGRADNVFLTSPNGVDWVPIDDLPQGNGRLVRVGGGFAWVGAQEVELWTSRDGTTWSMVDVSELGLPGGGLLGGGDHGDVVWFHQAEDVDRLWVLEFTGG